MKGIEYKEIEIGKTYSFHVPTRYNNAGDFLAKVLERQVFYSGHTRLKKVLINDPAHVYLWIEEEDVNGGVKKVSAVRYAL